MSADRYEIDMHDDGTFIITNLNGHRFIVDANCVDIRSRAIRQQARDLDQLRADLAAAVAERDRMAKHIKELDAECSVIAKDCICAEQQNDTLRARLAAIDAAPTVAVVSECAAGLYVHQKLFGAQLAEPGAELIYRPAKD